MSDIEEANTTPSPSLSDAKSALSDVHLLAAGGPVQAVAGIGQEMSPVEKSYLQGLCLILHRAMGQLSGDHPDIANAMNVTIHKIEAKL